MLPVGKLRLYVVGAQQRGGFHSGASAFPAVQRQLQRLSAPGSPAGQLQFLFQDGNPPDAGLQLFPISLRQIPVAQVQGLEDQVGRAGGSEQGEGPSGPGKIGSRRILGDVQVSASRQDGQRFVGGIAAHGGPQGDGMKRRLQKLQIGPVGIIHQQRQGMGPAHLSEAPDIQNVSQIVRRGDIHRSRLFLQGGKTPAQLSGRHRTAAQALSLLRIQPFHVQIQEGTAVKKGFMHISRRQD